MVRLRSLRCIFIHLIIFADVMRINARVEAISAGNRNGNDTRQVSPYTIAIFKGERQTPSHTVAVFKPQIPYTIAAIKPFINQTSLFAHDPLIYKPFLQPDQFMLVDQNESHEGEVLENDYPWPEVDLANEYTFGTNLQLSSDLTDDPYSYFPIREETTGNLNFTGYPAAPATQNFTGYPNAAYTTPHPVLLTTELLDSNTQMTKDKLHAFFHFGYKFWFGMLLFVVYHAIVVIVFHLSNLAKHYLQFPSALQAAAASDL